MKSNHGRFVIRKSDELQARSKGRRLRNCVPQAGLGGSPTFTQTRRTRFPERAEAHARLQDRQKHTPAHSQAARPVRRRLFHTESSNLCPRQSACPAAQSACKRSPQGHPAPYSARPALRLESRSGCRCKRSSIGSSASTGNAKAVSSRAASARRAKNFFMMNLPFNRWV